MTSTCPSCGCEQGAGLLCAAETEKLERNLGDVTYLVAELDIAVSKQARIGTQQGGSGLARERAPIHFGASAAATHLQDILGSWARDVSDEQWWPSKHRSPTVDAARLLLLRIDLIRRHPAVVELLEEVTDAIEQARRIIDRPADRSYLGQCLAEFPDDDGRAVTCLAEVWAKEDAHEASCRTCGATHVVADRRAWLLVQAADMLVTAKEASRYIGSVGHIDVTEGLIRTMLGRRKFACRPGTDRFRLGDLLDVLADSRPRTVDGRPMMTAVELATEHGVPVSTVRTRLSRLRAKAVEGHYDPTVLEKAAA